MAELATQKTTRDRLIEAAGELFAEKGFKETTVRDIIERAGANLAAVNYHFGDKERLYEEVILHILNGIKEEFPVAAIGETDTVFEAGGLGRRIRAYRLPDDNPHRQVDITLSVPLAGGGVHPLFVRLTQEDGHRAWSSPIYTRAAR